MTIAPGSTNNTLLAVAFDEDGQVVDDLAFNSDGISIYVQRIGQADSSPLTLSAKVGTAWAAGAFKNLTNGDISVDVADAFFDGFTGQMRIAGSFTGGIIVGVWERVGYPEVDVVQVLGSTAVVNNDVGTETKQDTILAAVNATVAVSVLPATGIVAARAPGFTLTPVVGELIAQSITLYETDGVTPYSLAGKSLAMVFEDRNGVDVAVIPNADIAVSGASSNTITFNYTAPITSAERTLRAALKDDASPFTEHAKGLCVVTSGPRVDA